VEGERRIYTLELSPNRLAQARKSSDGL
jgi:hypothetical protein